MVRKMATINAIDVIDSLENQKQINDKTIQTVSSISALRQTNARKDRALIKTVSYYEGLNKGGNEFIWVAESTEPDNGGSIIAVDDVTTGRWKSTQYTLNPYQFGAYGDLVINTSVEAFTSADIISGHDDTDAFQRMLNIISYTVYKNNISKLKIATTVKHVFEIHDAVYYVRDTLTVKSGTTLKFLGNAVIFFDPTTAKDLFSPSYTEMATAFSESTGWNTQSIYGVEISGGTFIGNMTKTSTVHANKCFNGANACKWKIRNVMVERFAIGCHLYALDTSQWTITRRGNFYENVLENCAFQECLLGFWNQANVTQCTNLTVGGGYIVNAVGATNKSNYFVQNEGGGLSVNGHNVAPAGKTLKPQKALIYDTCAGSFWGGGYSEYFPNYFELNPIHRWGGFSFKGNVTYKETEDCYVKFSEGFLGKYDYANGTRSDTDNPTEGHNQFVMSSAFDFGRNPQLIDDFFEFLPQYDFKYGMYGIRMNGNTSTNNLVCDVKRYEATWTGFTSKNGIRFWNRGTESVELALPIKNKQLDAYVCILYREITSYDPRNFKLNVLEFNGTNSRISVGDDVVDYGNGWKMATVRNINENVDSGNFIITMPVGTCIEIEHIGAYASGFPLMPIYMKYEPRVDSRNAFSRNNSYSGGKFAVGDIVYPIATLSSSGTILDEQKLNFAICVQEGTLKSVTDMAQYAGIASSPNTITTSPNTIDLLTGTAPQVNYYGVGDWLSITQSGQTLQYKIIGRVFNTDGTPSPKVLLGTNLNTGTGTVNAVPQPPVYRNMFPKNIRRSLAWDPVSINANSTNEFDIVMGNTFTSMTVDVFFSSDLKGTHLRAIVSSNGIVKVYHDNPNTTAVDVGSGTLTVIAYASGNEMS